MDSFDGMDVFARVVEAGGFTAAAKSLNLSKSVVSERVRALEARLGVRLLDRSTRRLTPTEAGRLYYQRCRQALDAAEAGAAEVQALQSEPSGLLRVAVGELFARLYLAPYLTPFLDANPLLRIEFVEAVTTQNLIEAGLDLAFRIAASPQPNLIVRRLADSKVVIVCSPDYLARFGAPQHPEEITRHRCIGFSPLFWGTEWRFKGPDGPLSVPVQPVVLANSTESLRAAALAGVGLTTLPTWGVADLLADGRLVRVLGEWTTPEAGIYAIYPSNRLLAPKVKLYVDHVARTLKNQEF
jgi:DNA-binding transcriptional LysR family regulator